VSISVSLIRELEEIDPKLRKVLFAMLEELERRREESVTKREFLAFAERTEENFQRVWEAIKELAQAQRKTEERLTRLETVVEELAQAQKKTEKEIAKLARGLESTRQQVGGLSRSVAYALENEAFRHLPKFLKASHGLEVVDRLIRTFVGEREINIFGKVRRDGEEIYLVGDAVLKLDDPSKLKQVWDQLGEVKEELGGEVLPIIITHFARPDVLERAKKAGILVVQSFEWV